MKSSARKDKRVFVDKLTEEVAEAARQNNIKALYDNIKLLTFNTRREVDQLKTWKEKLSIQRKNK